MIDRDIRLFALNATRAFGERLAARIGVPLAQHEERDFEDGEHKSRPLSSVAKAHVYVVQAIYSDDHESVNDKLCRLLFFIGAVRDAGARRVTALVPYLCYARKDRKTKPRDPVTTRYVAQLFESVGTDRIVTMDVHNVAAFENSFRCRSDDLEAKPLFVKYFADLLRDDEVAVVSPDVGGVKRAEALRSALADRLERPVASGFMEKQRSAGIVSGDMFVGDVKDRSTILIDDMIGTGTTMARAAAACRENGARRVLAAATHGLFVSPAHENLFGGSFDQVVVADTVPPFRLDDRSLENLVLLETAGLFADAVRDTF